MSSLAQRVVVALIIGPGLLIAAYFGGLAYFIPVTVLLLIAASEFSAITRALGRQTPNWLLLPGVAILLAAGQWAVPNLTGLALLVCLLAAVLFALKMHEWSASTDAALDWFTLVAGFMLLGWLGSHFFMLRNLPQNGWQWTAVAFISIWTADAAAYMVGVFLVGRVLGRHSLAPRISPNKTVEGYVGGVIASVIVTLVLAYLLKLSLPLAGIVALAVSTLSAAGDLIISLLKREAGVKDAGKLFPGHGGALDRFDSLIWAVAIAFYLIVFLNPYL
ncbi:MAG: phosphatidate cytidylyltransferase [Chloroflexota bacterium]